MPGLPLLRQAIAKKVEQGLSVHRQGVRVGGQQPAKATAGQRLGYFRGTQIQGLGQVLAEPDLARMGYELEQQSHILRPQTIKLAHTSQFTIRVLRIYDS
ncbi:MAG: hypothetical protein EOO61_09765 [Hymenobacter sp.]|nr:MAG: hypothetical protein EOO61_09765 [Hymenobacter sp.]